MPSEEAEVNDLEELQSEVNAMATKIIEYRSALPELLKSRFASVLDAYRPVVGIPASISDKDDILELENDDPTAEKILLLKHKMSSNASAIPIVLRRMNDCIARIDKLDAGNLTIHPVFKRKRID